MTDSPYAKGLALAARHPFTTAVVPTWNEAVWLPRLLRSLRGHAGIDEVIVADNGSTDGTREIAARFGCRVIDGGRPGPARNLGASASQGSHLLFIDADVVPTAAALDAVGAAQGSSWRGTLAFRHVPIDDDPFVRCCYRAADLWFLAARRIGLRHALASFLCVDRETFERVGGFDEAIEPGEDVDLVHRLGAVAPSRYRRDAPVLISARRFETEHGGIFAVKTAFWEALRAMRLRASPLPYRWERHDPARFEVEEAWLATRRKGA